MNPQQKLEQLGLRLPTPPKAVGLYAPALRSGNLVFTSGQIAMAAGELLGAGKVPVQVPLDLAAACARQAVLNALAAVAAVAGSLDAIRRIVRMNVFVNSSAGFTDQPKVANAASELLLELFGPAAGTHTRCATGAAELPLNSPVEIDLIVEMIS
ncbi:MAG: RidA family protein [Planctomycetaceae bacterium]|nr:RidA family protein [Planctomycetaceae bacterium]